MKQELAGELSNVVKPLQYAVTNGKLLELSFSSVSDYLFLLRAICVAAKPLGARFMTYLAAAVSDFYIPASEMAEHKMQSRDGELSLHLRQVPKMLGMVQHVWCPEAFNISFKLETDAAMLEKKARGALKAYGHHMVIANMLHTRHETVDVYSRGDAAPTTVKLADDESDLEPQLIAHVAMLHSKVCSREKEQDVN